MISFAKPQTQAEKALRKKICLGKPRHGQFNVKMIHSVGTLRCYTQALTRVAEWIVENRLGDLKGLTNEKALEYLEIRSQAVSQKTLDQERQAIQLHLGTQLPVIKSELTQALKSRAYTEPQINLIKAAQTAKHQLATEIALAAGLRAHELLTLRRKEERPASRHRQWSSQRFAGRQGEVYTVVGKGGLIREVLIPIYLAQKLELHRLTEPKEIKDRTIKYKTYYEMGGGKDWSNSFSAASKRTLDWSHGAHGLRHTYAQCRMDELQQAGFIYEQALGIVSQEMGHFRPDITEVYLR